MAESANPGGNGRPWYAEGLRFECQGCGRCCGGAPGFVWVGEDDLSLLAAHVGLDAPEFRRLYVRRTWRGLTLREKANYDCVMLDGGGRCQVYPVRPIQCRTWPFWPTNLSSPAAWSEASRRCRGIGRGPLYTLEEIEARRMEMLA